MDFISRRKNLKRPFLGRGRPLVDKKESRLASAFLQTESLKLIVYYLGLKLTNIYKN